MMSSRISNHLPQCRFRRVRGARGSRGGRSVRRGRAGGGGGGSRYGTGRCVGAWVGGSPPGATPCSKGCGLPRGRAGLLGTCDQASGGLLPSRWMTWVGSIGGRPGGWPESGGSGRAEPGGRPEFGGRPEPGGIGRPEPGGTRGSWPCRSGGGMRRPSGPAGGGTRRVRGYCWGSSPFTTEMVLTGALCWSAQCVRGGERG